jgi:hypothetical protein
MTLFFFYGVLPENKDHTSHIARFSFLQLKHKNGNIGKNSIRIALLSNIFSERNIMMRKFFMSLLLISGPILAADDVKYDPIILNPHVRSVSYLQSLRNQLVEEINQDEATLSETERVINTIKRAYGIDRMDDQLRFDTVYRIKKKIKSELKVRIESNTQKLICIDYILDRMEQVSERIACV